MTDRRMIVVSLFFPPSYVRASRSWHPERVQKLLGVPPRLSSASGHNTTERGLGRRIVDNCDTLEVLDGMS